MKPRTYLPLLAIALGFSAGTGTSGAATQTWLTANANNTWDLTQPNWDAGVVWVNGNDATFTGTVETVAIGAPVTANVINISGTGQWTFTSAANLTANTINVNTTGGGKFAFTGGGAVAGVSNIVVASGASLFSSGTSISAALSLVGTGNNENRGALRLDGGADYSGTITLAGNATIGSSSTSGTVSGGIGGTGTLSIAATSPSPLTFSGPMSMSGGFTQGTAAANTTLSGTNTYTGTTAINGGRLNLTGSVASSALAMANSTTLAGEGTAASISFGNTTLIVDPATPAAITATGALAATGTVTVSYATLPAAAGPVKVANFGSTTATTANFALANAGSYRSSTFHVNANDVTLDFTNAALVWAGTTATWEAGGADGDWNAGTDQFFLGDSVTFDDIAASNTTIALAAGLLPSSVTVSSSTNQYTFTTGSLTGGMALAKSGTSTLTLTSAHSYTGATTITGGSIILDSSAVTGAQNFLSGTTGAVSVGASGTFGIKVGGAGVDGNAYVQSRAITGSGALTFQGVGLTASREINLSGTMTGFTGSMAISSNTAFYLRVKAPRLADSATISVAAGGQFWDSSASGETVGYTFTSIAGTGEGGFGALRVAAGVTYSGNITVAAGGGRISGAGGTVGISTLTGLITGGPVELGNTGNASTLIVTNSGNTPASAQINAGGAVRVSSSTVLGSGTITQNGGTLMSTDTTARTFANAYLIGANSTLGDATNNGKITFTNTVGLVAATRTITTASDVEFSGTITNGGISHAGAGKLVLSGTGSSFSGNLIQNAPAGALDISGSVTLTGTAFFQTTTAGGTATVNLLSGGSITNNGTNGVIIAQNTANHTGIFNVSGTYLQTVGNFIVGNQVATSLGILNVENGGLVTFAATMNDSTASGAGNAAGVVFGRNGATGTVNLKTGGMISSAKDIVRGNGTANFNFEGGTLQALADRATFLQGLTAVTINSGGAKVDTNGFNITIGQALLAGTGTGGLTKQGTGTLTLGSAGSTYVGETVVSAGTLSLGNAFLADSSTVRIANTAVLDLTHGGTDTVDKLFINGVQVTASGTWGSTASGATHIDDTYFTGTGKLNVVTAGNAAYETWATNGGLTSGNKAANLDPDFDGLNNLAEFAFDGAPLSGANDGKIASKIATVDGDQVLTLTLPVRTGAVFSAPESTQLVSAAINGVIYHIQGSSGLDTFDLAISEVTGPDATAIQADLPELTAPDVNGGWSYRTFRAPGTITSASKAFLRAKVTE